MNDSPLYVAAAIATIISCVIAVISFLTRDSRGTQRQREQRPRDQPSPETDNRDVETRLMPGAFVGFAVGSALAILILGEENCEPEMWIAGIVGMLIGGAVGYNMRH